MDRVEFKPEITGSLSPAQQEAMNKEQAPQPDATTEADGTEAQQTDRPEWLPEGFNSPEELAKAYAELSSKADPKTGDEDKEDDVDPKAEVAESSDKLSKFSQEFFTSGKLSDKSYDQLAKMGIGKDIVDQFIAGQQAVMTQAEAEVLSAVGGKDSYNKVIDWARQSLKEEEILAYNKAVESGDRSQMLFAVQGLHARFVANNNEPKLIAGRPAKTSGFASTAEMVKAMSDPRYKNDPAYREEVARRVATSNSI